MAGLVRPRWVLRPPPPSGGGRDSDESSPSDTIYNAFPSRSHIDLRMEQNALFADSQEVRCRDLLSGLPPEGDRTMGQSWKKRADAIQGLIKEGLAACPGHRGLLSAETEYKTWLERRIGIISNSSTPSDPPAGGVTLSSMPALPGTRPAGTSTAATRAPLHSTAARKVDRAQAAMMDAMAERSFLVGSGPGKDEKYPLLGEDDVPGGEKDFAKSALDEGGKSPSSYFSDRDIHRKKYRKRKRDHKSKKRKKQDRRRRSESPDSRSDGSDRRSRRRRKKRKGKDRKKRKSRRASKRDSDESGNENRGLSESDSDDSRLDVRAKNLDPIDDRGDATQGVDAGKSHVATGLSLLYLCYRFRDFCRCSLTLAQSTSRLGRFSR